MEASSETDEEGDYESPPKTTKTSPTTTSPNQHVPGLDFGWERHTMVLNNKVESPNKKERRTRRGPCVLCELVRQPTNPKEYAKLATQWTCIECQDCYHPNCFVAMNKTESLHRLDSAAAMTVLSARKIFADKKPGRTHKSAGLCVATDIESVHLSFMQGMF